MYQINGQSLIHNIYKIIHIYSKKVRNKVYTYGLSYIALPGHVQNHYTKSLCK